MSGKGQLRRSKTESEENKQELKEIKELKRSLTLGSNQSMIEGLNLEEEEEENKIEEEEKKEENDNSGGDNSGDGIPGGENPDPENNPDEENDDVLKEESGSGSDGDSDDDEHKEFEINTSKKKKAAGAPLKSSKKLLSAKNGEVRDDENNIAGEFETLADVTRIGKIFRKGRSIKNLIKGKDAPEAINAIREKYGLTKEEIKTGEAVPRMMDPYFRAAISELSKDKNLNKKMRKELEDFSEEMDQQMLINAMKAPGEKQEITLGQYFMDSRDEKQLQREFQDKGLLKVALGIEGFKNNWKSWKEGAKKNNIEEAFHKKEKELDVQKESARSLFKIFLLMQIGELKQRDTDKLTGRKNETDWKHNVSDLFAHSGRVMITTGEREKGGAGTQDLLSSIFSKNSALEKRSAATHYITQGKEEPGSLEEIRGIGAAIKGKFSSDWNNYGMPVAIGGSGNLGPDKKRAILNDNRSGHLYVGAKEAEQYKRGGILIGLESDGPYRMNHWGHYHTATAAPETIQATGGMTEDRHGDKASGRKLYLRDIKNEELITLMNAVDKGFNDLYGNPEKEKEYEEILQKITGKKLKQEDLEKILKDLTGWKEINIKPKKTIPNIQEEIKPEEIESEDESLGDMFNPDNFNLGEDMLTNLVEENETDEKKKEREEKAKELFENNKEYQKLQEYLALKKKEESAGQDKLTGEEKEKIKKFENRKRFEVDKDDDENQENEENPLKSEEFLSLANYGPLLPEDDKNAADLKNENSDQDPQKMYQENAWQGQEWLYDIDTNGYYSAQASYTPNHFKDKKTAIDDSIFDMLSWMQEEKPKDTKEPNTEESSTEESNNYITGLGETNIKKVLPVEPYNPFKDNKSETKEPIAPKENEQPNSNKLTSSEQKQNMEIKKEEPKEQQKEVEKIIKQPGKEGPKQKNVFKAANKEVKSESPKITNNIFDLFGIKKSSESTEPNKGPVVKADHVEQQKKSVEEKKIEIKPNENINKNIIEKKPKVEKIKEQPKLKQIEPKQVRPEKKVSKKPAPKKEIEIKQKEETKEQLEEVKQKITQSEVKPITGNAEKNKTALDQDKTLIINNPGNNNGEKTGQLVNKSNILNNVIKQPKTQNTENKKITLTNKNKDTGSANSNKINNLKKPKPLNNLNNINRTQEEQRSDWNNININNLEPKKNKPGNKQIRLQNNLKPSDADLEFQPSGSNNCFVFVAAALLRYFGKENNIKGLENVKEQDLLKKYGIKRNGANNIKNKEVGKFENDFSYVRNTMSQNQTMSMGDIVEAIHDLSGDKAALNIKLISRPVLEENTEEDKEAKKSLKDIINYGVKNKNRPVGLLLGGDEGVGHYILVTGLTEDKNGFIYRDSTYKPETERTWTWDYLFRAHKHFQVCFLENTDKEPINQKDYTDISKPVTAKKNTNLDQGFVEFLNNIGDEEGRNKAYQEMMYWKERGEEKAANEIEADKKRVFTALDDNAIDKHLQHIDYYFYNDDDTKRSYFSLRPKKKKP